MAQATVPPIGALPRRPCVGFSGGGTAARGAVFLLLQNTEKSTTAYLKSRYYLRRWYVAWREPRCSATLRASQHRSIFALYIL